MYLSDAGLVCPVGLTSESACAAMRAGIQGFGELPLRLAQNGRIVAAAVPCVDLGQDLPVRLERMLSMAIEESLSRREMPRNVPLLLCLPESERPGTDQLCLDRILLALKNSLNVDFDSKRSRALPYGRTAAFMALRAAREILHNFDEISACLICATDSLIDPACLLWLNEQGWLKTDENSDGLIPGEAAAVIIVRRKDIGAERTVRVLGLGFGHEKATLYSGEPLMGLGLTAAARSALAEAKIEINQIDFRMSDITGLSFEFKEQALVISRLLRVHRDFDLPLFHCAEHVGDAGAASGLIQIIFALEAWHKGYVPGKLTACFTSAASGGRAVAILSHAR